jgi:uncharacterized protein YbjT (DUF2867 family)
MNVFVVGASGATGRLLVEHLLERGHVVKAIVRSPGSLPEALRSHEHLSVTQGSLLAMSDVELAQLVDGCDAIASCLGHNTTFKGMYGKPRRLVTDATRRLCAAVKEIGPEGSTKVVLMNTTGNRNRDLDEPVSLAQRLIVGLLRLVLPPHADNEQAADHLRTKIGHNDRLIEWVVVRPDGLIDEGAVSDYDVYPSPTRSAIFDAGKTSRINVGHFMADLISDDDLWQKWQGQMPAIYNKEA